MARARIVTAAATLALCGAAVLLFRETAVAVKGRVAAVLIEAAWRARLRDGRPHRPWPWADFTPIGRLVVPRLGIDRLVLSDASGRTLAFGLGQVCGSVRPGEPGRAAIAGHRNSWGRFLRDLKDGDDLVLTGPRGGARRYRVVERKVVARPSNGVWEWDSRSGSSWAGEDAIVLITCWPIDALRPGPLRYLVIGRPRPGEGGGGQEPQVNGRF